MLGISFFSGSSESCLEYIDAAVRQQQRISCIPVNVDVYVTAKKNDGLMAAIQAAELIPVDGMPLVWLSKALRRPVAERVTGSNLVVSLCEGAAEKGQRIFFLGGSEQSNREAMRRVGAQYGSEVCAGGYSPPFGFEKDPEECERIVNQINSSGANILFVCFGAPKQELWLHQHRDRLSVNVALCAGASIDFLSNTQRRAPVFFQKSGLEWLYRLFQDPKRMFKRYILKDTAFFYYAAKELLRKRG